MRVDILAIGSRGDVQPYIALGLGLYAAGHRVRLVTLGGFEKLVNGRGLDHLSIGVSPQEIADTTAGRDWVAHRTSKLGFLRSFVRLADSLIGGGISDYWRACRDVEALITSPMGLLIGGHIAERLGVPLIRTDLAPRPGWQGRESLVSGARGQWEALVGACFRFLVWSKLRRTTNLSREKILALPPLPLTEPIFAMDRQRTPLLEAYSPAVVPRPSHWDDWIHVTGYWFLDEPSDWMPPSELVEFLGSGPPPVFVGFGSTPFPEPEKATELVIGALAQSDHRGLLISGGSGLTTGRLTKEVLGVDFVPHSWLFPQVCAAVHHGGAGVTGAALRAGLPSVVVPVFADQPFWGQRVYQLGVGPRPIPVKQLTEYSLAVAIRATAGKEMRRRAVTLGEQIRQEDGVARALAIIHDYVGLVH
jgi:UDP:flavonoid glycosyltransferase YjiC (YdhE family)